MKTVILVLLMFLVVLTPAIIWVIVTVRTANRRGKPDPQLRLQLLTASKDMATILERNFTTWSQSEFAEGQVHPVKYLPHDTSRVWFVEKLSQN